MRIDSSLYREIEKNAYKIERLFTPEKRKEFLHTPIKDLDRYQFGLGTLIRLKLLRPQNTLYKAFIQHGVIDLHEMTLVVIKELHRRQKHGSGL